MKNFSVFDTETVEGKAFLIASSEQWRDLNSFDECLQFILSGHRLSFAYNMDYDASAILKYLPARDIDKLYLHNILRVNGYKLTYLPAKVFKVEGNGQSVEVFDLLQFYNMSLDNAAYKYLGERKDEIPHEVKSNLGMYYRMPEWTDKIRAYCLRDARLTYRLAEYFLNMLDVAGVETRKYYSTGYLAGKYLDKVTPGRLTDDVIEFVRPSYYGGRNECCHRGYIPECYIYDIKSAYPSVIRNLRSLHKAEYRMTTKPDIRAAYHVIRGKLTLKPGRFLYPIPWKDKRNGYIFYPRLKNKSVTITGPEYDVLQKHDLIDSFRGMETLNAYCSDERPFSFVDDLFAERQKSDAHSYIFKLILNSIYGKFYERRKTYVRMNASEMFRTDIRGAHELEYRKYLEHAKLNCPNAFRYFEKTCSCKYCTALYLLAQSTRWKRRKESTPVVVRDEDREFQYFRSLERGGKRFNILYASYITATIRARIYDAAVSVGENFIACFTDSIFSKSPLPEDFISSEIGMFEKKASAKNLVMVGTGVYEYETEGETYTRFRGFSRSGGLRDILNTETTDIELKSLMRITWGTIVQQTKIWKPDDFNKLVQRKRSLHVNFDHKRIWDSPFHSGGDTLIRSIASKPREI